MTGQWLGIGIVALVAAVFVYLIFRSTGSGRNRGSGGSAFGFLHDGRDNGDTGSSGGDFGGDSGGGGGGGE